MTSVRILKSFYVAVVVFECLLALGANATDVTEGEVTIVFDSVTPTKWTENGRTQLFQKALSAVANGYCSNSTAKCSLNSWNITRTFKPSNVFIVSGFPKKRGHDLEIKFNVTYPPGQDFSGNSKTALPASTVKEIVLQNKKNISDAVGETIKSVGEGTSDHDDNDAEEGESKSSSPLNYIMIPVSFTLLIILCLVTCCLHHCKNKQVRALKAQRIQQLQMAKQSKPQPTKLEEHVVSGGGQRRKKRVKRKKKEKQDEELGSSDDAPDKPIRANGTTVWFEDEEQLSPRGKSKKRKAQRKHLDTQQQEEEVNNLSRDQKDLDGHHSETREDVTDGVETDQLHKKKKKKKKKHRKRYVHRVDDEGSGASEQGQTEVIVMSDSQLGKLPSIRNLPPLKENQSVEV